ncbi:MAG: response regulator [Anaerolineae bacterium]
MERVSTDNDTFEAFLTALRAALQHLYDPLTLRGTPLIALFDVEEGKNPIAELRQMLIDGIKALEPGSDVPVHSSAWRVYHILRYRYIEQSAQRTVANNMGLSVRQLRRQERDAEKALAGYLWNRYNLERRAEVLFGPPQPEGRNGSTRPPGRERELEWVRDSFPSEVNDISAMIESTLRTVRPLVQALDVEVILAIPEDLPMVTGQRMPLRQAFLSLLTAAVHVVPGGQVRVSAEQQQEGIIVRLEAEDGEGASPAEAGDEHLQMARQCIDLFGGELIVDAPEEGDRAFASALRLPVTEPMPVLMIDDNLDTLRLFQRYLSGTHYQFVGVHDPDEVLSLAESLLPQAIVLDVMLPGVDGWELLGRLREHPATRELPTIVCTVMPQEQLAMALGAAAYLRKPVSRETLLSELDQQVSSRRTRSG